MLKKYDIVKKRCGFWDNMPDSNFNPEELFIIDYSYGEEYGNGTVYGGYCIVSLDYGSSSAWWDEDRLIFVKEGTAEDLQHAKDVYNENIRMHRDLSWIIEHFEFELPNSSILELFKEIGYDCGFDRHGEYALLYSDWVALFPIFNCIFNGDIESARSAIALTFQPEFVDRYTRSAETLYYKVEMLKISF